MAAQILFITGTDTGVGKTVLAARLTRQLRARDVRVAALKPVCSGGRGDARVLRKAGGNVLTLGEVNPWHFRAALAPLLAAREQGRSVRLREVVAHVRRIGKRFEVVVVEGAGGLLSPMGERFDSRDLILALRARPFVVCPNRLGAVNQVLLVLNALPRAVAARALVVLVSSRKPDRASRSNSRLLREKIGTQRVQVLAWLRLRERGAGAARFRFRALPAFLPMLRLRPSENRKRESAGAHRLPAPAMSTSRPRSKACLPSG